MNELPVEFARSARRHRIGKAHAMFVVENNSPEIVDEKYAWRGFDDRGLELDIVAVLKPDCLLVIHVMPTALRRRT